MAPATPWVAPRTTAARPRQPMAAHRATRPVAAVVAFGLAVPTIGSLDASPNSSATAPAGTGNPRYVSSGYTNPDNNLDVDGNGWLTPFDALLVVNALNRNGPRDLSTFEPQADNRVGFIDTSGDSLLSAFDVLLVIGELNRVAAAAEGESAEAGLGQPAVASAMESAGSEMSGGSSEIVNASIASAPSLAVVRPTWSRVNAGHQVEPRPESSDSATSPVTPMLSRRGGIFPGFRIVVTARG